MRWQTLRVNDRLNFVHKVSGFTLPPRKDAAA